MSRLDSLTFVAAIKKDPGPIPELKPPSGEIAFDLPEKAILGGVIFLGFAVLLLGRLLRRPRVIQPLPPEHPASAARRMLAQIATDAPPAIAAAEAAHAIRSYLRAAFGLGEEELTTAEISARFTTHQLADPNAASVVHEFLRDCDAAQFSPENVETLAGLPARAFKLIDDLEGRRTPPPAALSPPLPATT